MNTFVTFSGIDTRRSRDAMADEQNRRDRRREKGLIDLIYIKKPFSGCKTFKIRERRRYGGTTDFTFNDCLT
jgi:hypothetical protein